MGGLLGGSLLGRIIFPLLLGILILWAVQAIVGMAYPFFVFLAVLAWICVVAGLIHEYGHTGKFKLPRPVMDLLDKFTNKRTLEALVTAAQKAELIDAAAVAAKVKERVVGQDTVAEDVAMTIRRRLAQEEREKPVGVFCFAGPAGVGKTEMGKALADTLGRGFLFFDMSTCNTVAGATTLFGSPKGYAGSDSYGQLTSGLRDQPASVVLLDEFEKANGDVMKRFLTAWNDGFVTEASDGKKIPTNRAIFILTTNAAQERIGELARQISDRDQLVKATNAALQEEGFPPEVLSRIDRVFPFRPLEGLDIARVAIVHIVALVKKYGLAIAEGGIDPELLFEAMQRAELLQAAGGVRAIVRALEEKLADGLIEARSAGAKSVRLVVEPGASLRVERAD